MAEVQRNPHGGHQLARRIFMAAVMAGFGILVAGCTPGAESPPVSATPDPGAVLPPSLPPSAESPTPMSQPVPAAPGAAVSEVLIKAGTPRLYVNGDLTDPTLFFGNTDLNDSYGLTTSQAAKAARAGIHLHSMITNLVFTDGDPNAVYQDLRGDLDAIIDGDPDAKILIRVSVGNYNCTGYPFSEAVKYVASNEQNARMASIASDLWFEDAKRRLADLADYLRSSEKYAPHVLGYHLECGEWFMYMFRENGNDVSEPNNRKFRSWLTAKYGSDSNLRSAWDDPGITLETAEVPRDMPGNTHYDPCDRSLLDQPGDRRFMDYMDYVNVLTADRISGFAAVVKERTENTNVVIAFYGYLFELFDAQSGHFALRALLADSNLDGFAGPVTYADRTVDRIENIASSAFMSPVDAITRAGKIWFSESDQRTYINRTDRPGDAYLPSLPTLESVLEVHKREMGDAMLHGSGLWAMDLMAVGWLDDQAIWDNLGALSEMSAAYARNREAPSRFEVALVVDETAAHMLAQPTQTGVFLLNNMRLNAYRAGVSFSLIQIEDILEGRAEDCKVFFFLNPMDISHETAAALAGALHKDDKLSVFMYHFGRTAPEDVRLLTGMDIQTEPKAQSVAMEAEPGSRFGQSDVSATHVGVSAYSYIAGGAEVFGRYAQGGGKGRVSFGMSGGEGYRTVFYGGLDMPAALMGELSALGGANVFTETNGGVFMAGDELIVLQAGFNGSQTVTLPQTADVFDVFENTWYTGVSSLELAVEKGMSKILFYGDKDAIEQYGLPIWPGKDE